MKRCHVESVVQAAADGSCTIRLHQDSPSSSPSSSSSSSAAAAGASPTSRLDAVIVVTSSSPQPLQPPSPPLQAGYMSSYVTARSAGCGTVERPWPLRADPGQRIRLTLFDFTLAPTRSTNADGSPSTAAETVCLVYAVATEPTAGGQARTVCGGRGAQRGEQVMVSSGNAVNVRLMVGKRLQGGGKDKQTRPAQQQSGGDEEIENFMIGFQCTHTLYCTLCWIGYQRD